MFYYFFDGMFMMLSQHISLKVLVRDRKTAFWEIIYLASIFIFGEFLYRTLRLQLQLPVWGLYALNATSLLSLFYLCIKKEYSIKKAFIFVPVAYILASLSNLMTVLAYNIVYNVIYQMIGEAILPFAYRSYLITIHIVTIGFTFGLSKLFIKVTKGWRHKIKESPVLQNVLVITVIAAFIILIMFHLKFLIITENRTQASFAILSMFILVLAIFIIAVAISFMLYTKNLENKHQIQRKEDEQKTMQYYTDVIEKQYTDMRKFKHDYQNILSSLRGFIDENDLKGLKVYFNDKVEPASQKITKQEFTLENLSRIKVKEVKSILASKLMIAQEQDLAVQFDTREDIVDIPMNTVALVRMLGIILDNAIEALMDIPPIRKRELLVGAWNDDEGVTFVIQNTCSPEMPRLYELKKHGFSTKGENRGIGLSNLAEIVREESNVWLDTSIMGDQFIQKIVIEE